MLQCMNIIVLYTISNSGVVRDCYYKQDIRYQSLIITIYEDTDSYMYVYIMNICTQSNIYTYQCFLWHTIGPNNFLFGTAQFSLWARWHSYNQDYIITDNNPLFVNGFKINVFPMEHTITIVEHIKTLVNIYIYIYICCI